MPRDRSARNAATKMAGSRFPDSSPTGPPLSARIRDAKLKTKYRSGLTVHTYREPDIQSNSRIRKRKEYWEQICRIGGGGAGSVWLQKRKEGNRYVEERAVKHMKVKPLWEKNKLLTRELEIMARFSQKQYESYFVQSFGWYEGPLTLTIAMEYFVLGDLGRQIHGGVALSEQDAQDITTQILEGIRVMHQNRISHRDLKPGNILVKYRPPSNSWWVKIADFGLSKRAEWNGEQSTIHGTSRYMAPERRGLPVPGFNPEAIDPFPADMWAIGQIAFNMLTRQYALEETEVFHEYLSNKAATPSFLFKHELVSGVAEKFICSLMALPLGRRLTAKEALQHSWVSRGKSNVSRKMLEISQRTIVDLSTSDLQSHTPTFEPANTASTAESITHAPNDEISLDKGFIIRPCASVQSNDEEPASKLLQDETLLYRKRDEGHFPAGPLYERPSDAVIVPTQTQLEDAARVSNVVFPSGTPSGNTYTNAGNMVYNVEPTDYIQIDDNYDASAHPATTLILNDSDNMETNMSSQLSPTQAEHANPGITTANSTGELEAQLEQNSLRLRKEQRPRLPKSVGRVGASARIKKPKPWDSMRLRKPQKQNKARRNDIIRKNKIV